MNCTYCRREVTALCDIYVFVRGYHIKTVCVAKLCDDCLLLLLMYHPVIVKPKDALTPQETLDLIN